MIRPAKLEDVLSLMPLTKEFHYAAGAKRDALYEDSMEHWARWLITCITDPTKLCLLAEESGSPVGFLTAISAPVFWNPAVKVAAETVLWVTPSARGSGVGSALVQNLVNWAKEQGCSIVSAGANSKLGTKTVGKLLRKNGFELEEKIYAKRLK